MDVFEEQKMKINELLEEIWRGGATPTGDSGTFESPYEKQFNEIDEILESLVSGMRFNYNLEYKYAIQVSTDIIKQMMKANDDEE